MTSKLQFFTAFALSSCFVALPATAARTPFDDLEIVELTHTLDSRFPFIPVPGITFPFALSPIATIDANQWIVHEHLGTQIDAPNHFAKNGVGLDVLSATNLIVPMAVINRNIWGVGVDTLSFDPGNDNDYKSHKAVLGAGREGLLIGKLRASAMSFHHVCRE